MLSRNHSYFDKALCLDGHYIVTGYTNDHFCNDLLQLTDIREELHRYLRHEAGFEAVFFLDAANMLYCYDHQSFDILRNRNNGTITSQRAVRHAGDEIVAAGPMGRRHRRGAIQTPTAAAQISVDENTDNGPLHMGRMRLESAWQQLIARFRDPDLKCALVLNNINSLQHSMQTQELQMLEEISSYHDQNHSIVIYLFKDTSSITGLLDSGSHGTGPWTTFAETVLFPRIETDDPDANRVISLRTPNRFEIENLLHHMRFRDTEALRVCALDIPKLSEILAASCARNEWRLDRLMTTLDVYRSENPLTALSLQNWRDFTGEQDYRSPMETLDGMIGLDTVKAEIRSWYDLQRQRRRSRERSSAASSRFTPMDEPIGKNGHSLNILMKGNPGTGKTTVARLMGQLYYELGLLPQGQVIECTGADLISPNIGGTARLVREQVQRAMGGVLFIDEAYSLATDTHGAEALNQLTADMSAYEGNFAVILAGYPNEMDELMRNNNVGLKRRFPTVYHLPDYSAEEMQRIFMRMAAHDEDGISFDEELLARLPDFFEAWVGGATRGWGNAGEAQMLLTEMKKRCSTRLAAQSIHEGRLTFTVADIPERLSHCLAPRSHNLEEAFAEIDNMIGLREVKAFLKKLSRGILWGEDEKVPGNYIFSGPPGTGKTTIARKIGEILGYLGVLRRKTNNVVECRAADLLNGVRLLRDAVEDARGGILFIDEAHQLALHEQGRAIIRELVPLIEDPEIRADTCFICAGYDVEMKTFLSVDAGLSRRFPQNHRIRFYDYTAEELLQILNSMARAKGEIPDRGYLTRTLVALEKYMETRPQNFGNGGFIRDVYLPDSIAQRTSRLNKAVTGTVDAPVHENDVARYTYAERHTLTAQDIPPSFEQLAGPVGQKPMGCCHIDAKTDALVAKKSVVDYIHSLERSAEPSLFYDATRAVGLHFTISGPTGSGRHTAVRTIASALHYHGLLSRDDVHFVSKADLEAGYVGQTAEKTDRVVAHAMGGMLVVEYPSTLLERNDHDNSFGKDAIGVLVSAISTHLHDFCVVFLDTEEGLSAFFKAYPSLRGSFARHFSLDDLSADDMYRLFVMKTKNSIVLEEKTAELLPDFFTNWVCDRGALGESMRSWGNGMEVDALIEDLISNWNHQQGKTRTALLTESDTENSAEALIRRLAPEEDGIKREYHITRRYITREMFSEKYRRYLKKSAAMGSEALAELEKMVGLRGVKESIRRIERRLRRMPSANVFPGCYCYLGNPGVGKTTVAKLMGNVLKATGVLSQGHVIVRTARQMCANLHEFDDTVKLAKNGILFIDEAHQLAEPGNTQGNRVIKRLLTIFEDTDVMKDLCIILAGYTMDMLYMLAHTDSGLSSRFGTESSKIYFDDYSPEELLMILDRMASDAEHIAQIGSAYPLRMDDGYRACALSVFRRVCEEGDPNFGNARFVRNFLHDSLDALLLRLDREYGEIDDPPYDVIDLLTADDIPSRYKRGLKNDTKTVLLHPNSLRTTYMKPITGANYDLTCETYSQSVVFLEIFNDGQKIGEGSGSIVTAEGHILACAHEVKKGNLFRARVYTPGAVGGDYRWFPCELLAPICEDCDMAILKMDGTHFIPISMRPPEIPIGMAEETLILGYPLGSLINDREVHSLHISNFAGRIASCQRVKGAERYYVDSTGLQGNSGSPVFSRRDGRMIGVFTGSVHPSEDGNLDEINYFYPITYFYERYVDMTTFDSDLIEMAEEVL